MKQKPAEIPATQRDIVLDVTRGIAIILVVFFHAEMIYARSWSVADVWYVQAQLYFAMEAFFFISGYLAYSRLTMQGMQRRFFVLIIPFIFWSILLYYWSAFSFSGLEGIYPIKEGVIQNILYCGWTLSASGIWFLPALFGLSVLLYLSRGKVWGILLIIVAAYGLSQITFFQEPLGLPRTAWFERIAWFMPFLAGGYLAAKYREKLSVLKHFQWFALVAFPAFFYLQRQLNVEFSFYTWPGYTATVSEILAGFFRFWLSCLGVGMAFAVANLISRIVGVRRVFAYLGVISLGIYCAHGMWRNIGVGDGLSRVVIMTVVATLLAAATTWILQRFWATDFIFFGNTRRLRFLSAISFRRRGQAADKPVKNQDTGERA